MEEHMLEQENVISFLEKKIKIKFDAVIYLFIVSETSEQHI